MALPNRLARLQEAANRIGDELGLIPSAGDMVDELEDRINARLNDIETRLAVNEIRFYNSHLPDNKPFRLPPLGPDVQLQDLPQTKAAVYDSERVRCEHFAQALGLSGEGTVEELRRRILIHLGMLIV